MVLVRSGFGIAALAAGIVAGFILYRAPSPATRLSERAFHLSSSGDLGQAVAVYSEQIRRRPGDYILYLRRGLTQKRRGDLDAALADFDAALKRIPPVLDAEALGRRLYNSALPETHVMAMAVEIHTERAEALQALGRTDQALAAFDAAIALNLRNPGLLYRRAWLRMLTGDFDGARADFDRILSRGMNVDAVFGRGLVAYLRGDWPAAAQDFARVLLVAPRSETFALWLLKAQLRAHQPIPLEEFDHLPKGSPAWRWINAFLADYGAVATGLRNAAGSDPAQSCNAAQMRGEWLVIKDDPEAAAGAFRTALSLCPPLSVPRLAAEVELQRLENPGRPFTKAADRK